MDLYQLRLLIIMEVLFQQYLIDMDDDGLHGDLVLSRKGAAMAAATADSSANRLLHAYLDGRYRPPARSTWSFLPTNRPN